MVKMMFSNENKIVTNFPRGKKQTTDKNKSSSIQVVKTKPTDDLFHVAKTKVKKAQDLKKKKRQRQKFNKQNQQDIGIKITSAEALSYKQLSEGMVILGCISSISELSLKISLPGHLVGTVPINAISKPYTEALQKIANGGDEEGIRPLKDMFKVGQVYMCCVDSIEHTEKKFNVKLSLMPQKVQNIPPSSLKKGFVVQAAVKSVEDHGYIMDIGVAGTKAFLSLKKAEQYIDNILDGISPSIGQLLPVLITKFDCVAVTLTAEPSKIKSASADPAECSTHTILPGMSFQVVVEDKIKGGMSVNFGQFSGYVFRDHISGEISVDDNIHARVLYILPTVNTIYLTTKPHLKWCTKPEDPLQEIPIGSMFKNNAEVINSKREEIIVKLPTNDDTLKVGSIKYNHISDKNEIIKLKEKFPVGTKVSCKVFQYDYLDGIYICSMKKSVLEQIVVERSQLKIGDKVKCKITKYTDNGVVVEIGKNIKAFISFLHLSDVQLKNPEKKYPIGSKLNCRILNINDDRNKIFLTNKSILVKEEYQIVSEFDKKYIGITTEGVVQRVSPDGLLLNLYGDAKGWVPKSMMSTEKIDYPEKLFYVGQVLKCQIVKVEEENKKMILSLIIGGTHKPLGSKEKKSGQNIKLGSFFNLKVVEVNEDGLSCEIDEDKDEKVKAFVPKNHLTDHVDLADGLLSTYKKGDIIKEALCFEKDVVPIFTKKPIIVNAVQKKLLPRTFEDLQIGVCVPGVVGLIKNYGIFLRLPTWGFKKSALVPMRFLADFFVENPEDYLVLHQTVIGKVIERNETEKKLTMTLQLKQMNKNETEDTVGSIQSMLSDRNNIAKNLHKKLMKYQPGTCVVGKVIDNTELGIQLNINGITGIITKSSLSDTSLEVETNAEISSVVLYTDVEFGCLELSCNPDIVKRSTHQVKSLPQVDSSVKAIVVLVKSNLYYALLQIKSGPSTGLLIYIPTRLHINDQVGFADTLNLGEAHSVIIKSVSDLGVIGILEKQERKLLNKDTKKRTRKNSLESNSIVSKRVRMDSEMSVASSCHDELNESKEVDSTMEVDEQKTENDNKKKDPKDPGWDNEFNPWGDKATKKKKSGDNSENSETKKLKTHLSKSEKKKLDRLEAEEIARTEQRILDGEEVAPESIEEFERLVMGTPNSSLCWIQYMAFHMDRKEYDKARVVAQRSLEKINFREEEERLNIYIAWINMENTIGDEKATDEILSKALKHNDEYSVYTKVANMFDLSGKYEKAVKIYKLMAKKYCKEPDVWTNLGSHYFQRKNLKEARFTLQRSIQNLEKKHHVDVTVKFGQMEFKMGEVERGKTVFETVLENFPNRNDIWNVYIDMLVKINEIEVARNVCDKMTFLKLKPEKMKKLFKKFLEFEEKHGTQQDIDRVKKKALDYVEGTETELN